MIAAAFVVYKIKVSEYIHGFKDTGLQNDTLSSKKVSGRSRARANNGKRRFPNSTEALLS
jgi:hypothetical protein